MYILPYLKKPGKPMITGGTVWTIWVFMSAGGTAIWKTDEEVCSVETIQEEYLKPNGFVASRICVKEGCAIVEIDAGAGPGSGPCEATRLSDFYTWTEFHEKRQVVPITHDCWRPFFWIGESWPPRADEWGWMEAAENLPLGSFGNGQRLWKLIGLSEADEV